MEHLERAIIEAFLYFLCKIETFEITVYYHENFVAKTWRKMHAHCKHVPAEARLIIRFIFMNTFATTF